MSDGWQRNRRVSEVLDEADVLYLAVAASRGPHVTPAVFDIEGDRLWFVTPRRSVKAKVIDRRRRVGGLVQLGQWSVVFGGRARIVDPLTARGVFSPGRLLDLPFAAAGYLGRNYRHATGTIRDHQAPTLALSRVLVSVDIRRLALLDGWTVVDRWGRWDGDDRLPTGESPTGTTTPDLTSMPPGVRTLLGDDSPAALGWNSPDGPLALPARWLGSELQTSTEALVMAGATSLSPACVCAERSRYRLKSKQGVLLTGEGLARQSDNESAARVSLDIHRTTWWRGEEAHTITAHSA